jgi:hypothetical protein
MPFNYCIAIGQFENPIKQFHKLIVSYANSIFRKKYICLILGNGDRDTLEKVAKERGAQFCSFSGYQENPFKYLKANFNFK